MINKLVEEYEKEWEKVKELNRITKSIDTTFVQEKNKLHSLYEDIFLDGVLKSDKVKLYGYDSDKKEGKRWSGCYIKGSYRNKGIVIGRRIGKQSKYGSQAKYEYASTDFELKAIKKFGDKIAKELSNYDSKKENMKTMYKNMKNYLPIDWRLERKYDEETRIVVPETSGYGHSNTEMIDTETEEVILTINERGEVNLIIGGDDFHIDCKFPITVYNYTQVFALSQRYKLFKRWIKLGVKHYKNTVKKKATNVRKKIYKDFRSFLVKKGI